MPVVTSYVGGHREKLSDPNLELLSLVARPAKRAEMMKNPKAQKAVGEECDKIKKISTRLHDTVREYDDVCAEALQGEEVHFGRVFALCHEKHWEDPSLSKYKGRVVFQGNNATDQTATMAAFSDIGSSACLLSASKMADVVAIAPGNSGQQADAP